MRAARRRRRPGGVPRPLAARSAAGGEQGLLSVAFAPDYERRACSTSTTRTPTATPGSSSTSARSDDAAVADPRSAREVCRPGPAVPQPQRRPVLFGPDGDLYIGLGDGGSAGDPERNGQDLGHAARQAPADRPAAEGKPYGSRDNPFADGPRARDLRLRPAQPVALLVRPRDRRPLDRRRRPGRARGDRPRRRAAKARAPTSAGRRSRAPSASTRTRRRRARSAGAHLRPRRGLLGHRRLRRPRPARCESLYGRYLYGDFCDGQLRSFTAARRAEPADDDRELGVEVPALSSFGEDVDGHVYATSLEGPVYRLEADG